jgi:hypothetical protein
MLFFRSRLAALLVLFGSFACLAGGSERPPALRHRALKALDGDKIVFAARCRFWEHWYATFGYFSWASDDHINDHRKGLSNRNWLLNRDGGALVLLDPVTGKTTSLIETPDGSVRDPCVHYDGETILFSMRRGQDPHWHLYEIQTDGAGLRQITSGPYDDIEPVYLPDDHIVFVSSRCNRWVPCWFTQVAVLYRCDRSGGSMRALSTNVEHENTPWVMPDGRVLYMRWEYVDRHVNLFHHLWTINPDGSNAQAFFGNQNPGGLFIDAKPIPGSPCVVLTAGPGHGLDEHRGKIAILNPNAGPDDLTQLNVLDTGVQDRSRGASDQIYRDPYPLAPDLFLAARGYSLVLLDDQAREEVLFSLDDPQQDGWIRQLPPSRMPSPSRSRDAHPPRGGSPSERTQDLSSVHRRAQNA